MQIYYRFYDDQRTEQQWKNTYQRLSEQRRRKVDGMTTEDGRWQQLLASGLLEDALEAYGCERPYTYQYSQRGKPSLQTEHVSHRLPDAQFSLSHCKKMAACAVDADVIGVDVEMRGRYREAVVRRFFSQREQQCLQEWEEDPVQQDALFTILWTRKEALAKCLDLPLEQVCAQVDVSGTLRSRTEQCWADDMTQTDEIALRQNSVYVRSFFLQDVVLSVASLRESTVVPQEMWWNGADSIDFH